VLSKAAERVRACLIRIACPSAIEIAVTVIALVARSYRTCDPNTRQSVHNEIRTMGRRKFVERFTPRYRRTGG